MISDRVYKKSHSRNWELQTSELGATKWVYHETPVAQSFFVKYLLDTFTDSERKEVESEINAGLGTDDVTNAKIKGARFFSRLQDHSGIIPMQYKGPMFMTVGYVVVSYVTKQEIPEPFKQELIKYLVNTAHPVDGGWGLYEGGKSTCFGTALNYVVLRLLGLPADHVTCIRARKCLHALGGALRAPHWGKAWLSVLNLYKWDGVNPVPPELWLLPYNHNPIHPGKWWVHTRAVYQPMGYLYSCGFQTECDELIKQLRKEIYVQDFESINFPGHRNDVANVDLYYPHTSVLNAANELMVFYYKYVSPSWLAKSARNKVYGIIKKELQNTENLCIAPVSFAFNAVVVFLEEGTSSELFQSMWRGFQDVLFLGPQGMCAMGTNGGQVWDVGFALQYFVLSGLADRDEFRDMIERGYDFLLRSQFVTDCVENSFRDKRIGAFPYSTRPQGYTVSDCTAESIKAILMVKSHPKFGHLKCNEELLFRGIDVLLSLQNVGSFHFGSFSTYEKIRATPLLEKINPAEVFGNIMVEYPYVECTDSVVLGLTYFAEKYDYKKPEIETAIKNAINYICSAQAADGSWYGCWGICFTYAGMFALEALSTVNQFYHNNETVRKGCEFLVAHQLPDGGWGESMKSCETHTYVSTKESLVVQTAWSVIALILAKYPQKDVVARGVQFLVTQQKSNGEWENKGTEGVFNHSCGIEYPNYKFVFPIKALGLYEHYRND